MAKTPRCKFCERGVKLTGTDHWIVKSIIPARINVKPCPIARAALQRQAEEDGR